MRTYSILICLLSFLFLDNRLQAQQTKQFVWGINGHPLTQEAYRQSTWGDQIGFLKELGLAFYRIDVPLNSNGLIRHELRFNQFVSLLQKSAIKPMPVVFPKFNNQSLDSAEIYNWSFREGKLFCERYKNTLEVLEVGNELEVKLLKGNGRMDGTSAMHYDLAKSKKLMWNLAGFIDGMKSVKPSLRVSISLGWTHWYYLELLKNYDINYDIIGYHWYDNMGDITNAAKPYGNFLPRLKKKYGKEIWITEFNTHKGTLNRSIERQDLYLSESLSNILKQGIVTGFFFYELFDEPALKLKAPQEAYYGLLTIEKLKYKKKAVFQTYKKFINQEATK